MIKLAAPMLPGLRDSKKAGAVCRRLGLDHIEKDDIEYICFDNALSDAEKESLLKRSDSENLPLLIRACSIEELEKAVLWVNLWRNRMCEPDELWDVYDAEGNLTGRTHLRAVPLKSDEYHLCVHVWTLNSKGEFLLTKRAENKSMPGLWESTGGSVTAGEDSFSAALREVQEETGIELIPDRGEFLFRYSGLSFHCDIWLFRQDFELDKVRLLEGETCGAMAAGKEKIMQLMQEGQFVPYEYIEDFLNSIE